MDFINFIKDTGNIVEAMGKPWEAKKGEILRFWHTLRPYLPIRMEPIPANHIGNRYPFDGIRITGTSDFIGSVLSRIKDVLQQGSYPGVDLDVEYRQVQNRGKDMYSGPRFVCFIHVVEKKLKPPS
jgi:hypothetical protein